MSYYKHAASKLQKEPKAVWCYMNANDCQSCLGYTEAYIAYFKKNNVPYYVIWRSDKLDKKDQIADFTNLFGNDNTKRMILESNFPKQLQYRPKSTLIVYNKLKNEFEFKGVDLKLSDLENIKNQINVNNVAPYIGATRNSKNDVNSVRNFDSLPWIKIISKIDERSFLLDTCRGYYFLNGYSGKLYRYNPKEQEKMLCFDPKVFVNQNYSKLVKVFVDCNPNFKVNADSLILYKQLLDTLAFKMKFGWVMSTKYIFTNDPDKIGIAVNFSFCRDPYDKTKVFEQGCAVSFIALGKNIDEEYYSYPIFNDLGTPIMNYSTRINADFNKLPVVFLKTMEDDSKIIRIALMEMSKSIKEEGSFTFFVQDSIITNNLILNTSGLNLQCNDTLVMYVPQFQKFYYLNQNFDVQNVLSFPFNDINCSGFIYKEKPLLFHYTYGSEEVGIQTLWYNQEKWVEGNSFVEKNKNSGIGYYIEGDKLMRIGNGKNGKIEFKTMGKLGF
jgi:hypothetical protein